VPNTTFVRASSNSSIDNVGGTVWTLSLATTNAGDFLVLFVEARLVGAGSYAISDSQGNIWHAGSIFYITGPILSGGTTITLTMSGTTLKNIAMAVCEYSGFVNATNDYIGSFGYGTPSGAASNQNSVPAGSGLTNNSTGVNAPWAALTAYDASGLTAPITASDTESPSYMQFVFNSGVSGAIPPAWNHTGGNTADNTVEWNSLGSFLTPSGVMVPLMVGTSPFVEFPNPGAGWTLRTSASNFNGIAVYDRLQAWNSGVAVDTNKSADTYDLDISYQAIPGFFTASPPTPSGGPIIIQPTTLPFLPLPGCPGEACVVF